MGVYTDGPLGRGAFLKWPGVEPAEFVGPWLKWILREPAVAGEIDQGLHLGKFHVNSQHADSFTGRPGENLWIGL